VTASGVKAATELLALFPAWLRGKSCCSFSFSPRHPSVALGHRHPMRTMMR
jgi:hypothetical protein